MARRPPRFCCVPYCSELAALEGRGRCLGHRAEYFRAVDEERGTTTERGLGSAWQKLRKFILDRDHWTCVKCFEPATEVDHVAPRALAKRLGWSRERTDDPSNLQSLCHDCHAEKSAAERNAA